MPHLHVVGAVVLRGKEVLAARRGENRYPYVAHKFEFVGGKVEQGESEEEALVRELREELGVKARVIGHFKTVSHDYPDFSITLSAYFCEFLSDFSCAEHEELRWIPLAELDPEAWAAADAPLVQSLKTLIASRKKAANVRPRMQSKILSAVYKKGTGCTEAACSPKENGGAKRIIALREGNFHEE